MTNIEAHAIVDCDSGLRFYRRVPLQMTLVFSCRQFAQTGCRGTRPHITLPAN